MTTIDQSKLSNEVKEKYSIVNNSFTFKPKDDPKDRIETEIGDTKQADFFPQVKIKRWDNEVNCSIRLKHEEKNPVIVDEEGKIKWRGNKIEAHFYDILEGEGGYEFEVILKKKPKTNIIEFTLVDKDVEYFYQPELTQKEKDRGAERPENVIGSYAVYASKNKTNYAGGKEYKCGKVGHIYRPKIIDSAGTEVWGELQIENGILSVTIPQDFLDKAVYPVRHAAGLTFGYNTIGTTGARTVYPDQAWGGVYASPAGATNISSISIYAYTDTSPATHWKGLISLDSTGNLLTNGIGGATTLPNWESIDWSTSNFSTPPTISASTNYGLWGVFESDYDFAVNFYYDEAYDIERNSDNSYSSPSNPGNYDPGDGYKFSIYATYTAGGVAGPAKLKTWNGLSNTKIKTINGLEIAKVKSINGLL